MYVTDGPLGVPKHLTHLTQLLTVHGGPGNEHAVSARMAELLRDYTDDIHTDPVGNLVARVCGEGTGRRPRVMLCAHMDEIALVVTQVESGGFLRVGQAGGFDPRTLIGQEVIVHGRRPLKGIIGAKPPHLTSPQEREQAPGLEELFVDLAMSEPRVREWVSVGDLVTVDREPLELLNRRWAGKALDNRVSLAVLLETLEQLARLRHHADVYVVASVQEEVGPFGARVASFGLSPDIGIAVDVTYGDFPGQPADANFRLGKGPVITYGPNIHPKVFAGLRDTAEEHHIPYQIELSQGPTWTDAAEIQIAQAGIATGLVGIAIRYMHTSVETGCYDDIADCGKLLAHYIARLDNAAVEGLTCY